MFYLATFFFVLFVYLFLLPLMANKLVCFRKLMGRRMHSTVVVSDRCEIAMSKQRVTPPPETTPWSLPPYLPPYLGRLGFHLVGRIGSGVLVSASFQKNLWRIKLIKKCPPVLSYRSKKGGELLSGGGVVRGCDLQRYIVSLETTRSKPSVNCKAVLGHVRSLCAQ